MNSQKVFAADADRKSRSKNNPEQDFLSDVGFSGAGFSLWGLVLAMSKIRRLKPAPLTNRLRDL
jgi:hypothetical protein